MDGGAEGMRSQIPLPEKTEINLFPITWEILFVAPREILPPPIKTNPVLQLCCAPTLLGFNLFNLEIGRLF